MASRRHLDIGRLGELIAARFLSGRGARIDGRNVRNGRGEIDLIALIDGRRVAVEVKTARRASGIDPRENLDDHKLDMVRHTAAGLDPPIHRVDLVAVTLDGDGAAVRWLRDVV
jgi:putative endonuclease